MMNMIPDTILRALCWTLLHSLWQGLLVAMIAGLIMVLTKRSSSALRYNLLCGLLVLFLGASGYTFYRQLPVAKELIAAPAVVGIGQQPVAHIAPSITSAPIANGIDSLIQYFNTHAALIVLIWFIIFLARFVQMLSGLVYTQRIRHYKTSPAPAHWQERLRELVGKLQITRPVSLLESALIKIPVVVGVLKPVILVPVGMLARISPDQVESILLHELAHIRRKDYLFNLVQNLVDTIYFFNPAMIWLSSLIRVERENCCDDIAIRETRSRRRLIEALVSFHEYERSTAGYALSFAEKENQVVRRVKRIVHKTNHSLDAGERVLLMGGLLILSAAFITINNSRADQPKSAKPAALASPATTKQAPVQPVVHNKTAQHIAKPEKSSPVSMILPAEDTVPKTQPKEDIFQNASVDLIIAAKEHGVTSEFVNELQQMGYKHLSLGKAIELVDHGVNAAFIGDIQKLGYPNFSLDMAIKLRDHGVTVEFINRIRDMGFENFSLEKAIELVDRGVSADYIADMKKRFGKNLELNDYIKLKDAGISPSSL